MPTEGVQFSEKGLFVAKPAGCVGYLAREFVYYNIICIVFHIFNVAIGPMSPQKCKTILGHPPFCRFETSVFVIFQNTKVILQTKNMKNAIKISSFHFPKKNIYFLWLLRARISVMKAMFSRFHHGERPCLSYFNLSS